MNDPTWPLQTAVRVALDAKLTAQGYTNVHDRVILDPEPQDALPYIVIGTDVSVIPFSDKSTEGGECTYTSVCWATTLTAASTLADECLQALTDRTSPISVTGYDLVSSELDFRGAPLREEAPGTDSSWYWGVPVRVRFRLYES